MDATPDIGEGQRHALISNIREVDRRSFSDWVEDPQNQRRLDLPKPVLRHLLIPPRVLELAEDPSQVGVVVEGQTSHTLDTFIVEHKQSPITNKESLERYMQQREAFKEEYRAKARAQGTFTLYPKEGWPAIPDDIDSQHVEHYDLVQKGLIGLNDYVINRVRLRNDRHPELLFVGDYSDREELRGKGNILDRRA